MAPTGVMLLELCDSSVLQGELDLEDEGGRDRGQLMGAIDRINARWGRSTVWQGSAGTATARRDWVMRQERRTPQYTTRLSDVPVARA